MGYEITASSIELAQLKFAPDANLIQVATQLMVGLRLPPSLDLVNYSGEASKHHYGHRRAAHESSLVRYQYEITDYDSSP